MLHLAQESSSTMTETTILFQWDEADLKDMEDFAREVHEILGEHFEKLPPSMRQFAPSKYSADKQDPPSITHHKPKRQSNLCKAVLKRNMTNKLSAAQTEEAAQKSPGEIVFEAE